LLLLLLLLLVSHSYGKFGEKKYKKASTMNIKFKKLFRCCLVYTFENLPPEIPAGRGKVFLIAFENDEPR
jgi:hypothetical protein